MTLGDARLMFALRSKMTRTVQMNYKGDPEFRKNGWKCVGCGEPDLQEHVVSCSAYGHLRSNLDLRTDKDMVKYYKEVIAIREGVYVGL